MTRKIPVWRTLTAVVVILLAASIQASADTFELEVVDTFTKASPFGLAYDGTHIYWSDFGGTIHQMTTSGIDTGVTQSSPAGASELGWSGTQLVASSGTNIFFFDPVTGANQSTLAITAPISGFSLIDGLDFDHNEIWYSPDVGNVYRLDLNGEFVGPNPVLGGAGGFSGVERIDVGMNSFLIVVNDASNPRTLCLSTLNGTLGNCVTLTNSRFEGLAFDGRYLYAADLFGNAIQKLDLKVDGGSIFEPPPNTIPEPATMILLGTGLAGIGAKIRKRRQTKAE